MRPAFISFVFACLLVPAFRAYAADNADSRDDLFPDVPTKPIDAPAPSNLPKPKPVIMSPSPNAPRPIPAASVVAPAITAQPSATPAVVDAPAASTDPDPQVAQALAYYNQVQTLAVHAQAVAASAAFQRLLAIVIKSNNDNLRAANPREAGLQDNLQQKLGDLLGRTAALTPDASPPAIADLGAPEDWPQSYPITTAIKACDQALQQAAANRQQSLNTAAAKVASDLQSSIAHAIQRGDAAEAGRISAIRNQYVMLTRGIATPKAEAAHKIDLLKLLNIQRDAVNGKWQFKDGVLNSDESNQVRLQWHYQPPAEYDYRVVFSRESGNDCICMAVVMGGHQTCWEMGSYTDTKCCFERTAAPGPQVHGVHCLAQHGRYECVLKVRKNSVEVWVNGVLIGADRGNKSAPGEKPAGDIWGKYSMPAPWKLPDTKALGMGSFHSSFKIYAAEVQEISGPGKVTK